MKIDIKDIDINLAIKILNSLKNENTEVKVLSEGFIESLDSYESEEISTNEENTVDADGLTWDERIHSSNKKFKADGTWTRRRGIDDDYFETILAEIKGEPILETSIAPQAPELMFQQPTYVAPQAPETMFQQPVHVAPQAPVEQPVYTANEQPVDFATLMQSVSALFSQQKITTDIMTSLFQNASQAFGVQISSMTDAQNDSRIVNYIYNDLMSRGL